MSSPEDRNITWHPSSIDTRDRERLRGHRGITLWFTGLSASGKSTVAREVEDQLYNRGLYAYVLDGEDGHFCHEVASQRVHVRGADASYPEGYRVLLLLEQLDVHLILASLFVLLSCGSRRAGAG